MVRPARHHSAPTPSNPFRRDISPVRRALHLIDIENLCGTGRPTADRLEECDARYRCAVTVGPRDLLVVGTGSDQMTRYLIGSKYRGVPVHWCPGPDGGEQALITALHSEPDVTGRFSELVIGSGDNAFTSIANFYARAGLIVTVVAPADSISGSLAKVATRVIALGWESERFTVDEPDRPLIPEWSHAVTHELYRDRIPGSFERTPGRRVPTHPPAGPYCES